MASKKSAGVIHKPVPMASGPVLIALASLRNTEAQLRWQGAQWAITLNVSALIALAYRVIGDPKVLEFFILVIGCAVVAVLNAVWYNVLRRDGKFLDFWNKKILEHEKANSIDGGMKVFDSTEYAKLSRSRNRLQRRLERLTVVFIYLWTIASVVLLTWTLAVIVRGGIR